MMSPAAVPDTVYTLWAIVLAVTALIFVPLSVYLLHALRRTTLSVQSYAREGLAAARGVERNAAALPALDSTISVATEVLAAAESVAGKLGTIATVLESRAAGRR